MTKRPWLWILVAMVLLCAGSPAVAQDTDAEKAEEARKQKEAQAYYDKCADLYMVKGDYETLTKELRARRLHLRYLSSEQREDLNYLPRTIAGFRPNWWDKTKSTRNITFTAKIWNRGFKANYMPTDMLGIQAAVGIRNGRLLTIVSWRPNLVDNPDDAEGELAKIHKITKGDIAECIIWHEMGHNYISNFLPLKHVIKLYEDYSILFHNLQEFYADMTALTHGSPKATKVQLLIRLPGLRENIERDPHMRGAYGIGTILLQEILSEPRTLRERWPNIHLPGKVPAEDIERNVLVYMYENMDPNWSMREDRQMRSLLKGFLTRRRGRYTQGEAILREKGTISLPNKLEYKLIPMLDRDNQKKRDAWVKKQLEAAIESKQCDKPKKVTPNRWDRPSLNMPW
ncbi:MAG: hypothetical protein ACLFV7_01165 [Phycisphaerae bacterium]